MNEPQPLSVSGQKPKQGLSTTSFVLGLLSVMCFGIFAGLPAIITGHVARARARREPSVHGGAGLALAGLILGYISIFLTLLLSALLLPALAKAKARAQTIGCVNNMRQIGLAARIYANDHGDIFPPNFQTMSNELGTPKLLVCAGDSEHTKAMDWASFNADRNITYEFLIPNAKKADVADQVVFRCPIHQNISLGDGSVQQGSGRRR